MQFFKWLLLIVGVVLVIDGLWVVGYVASGQYQHRVQYYPQGNDVVPVYKAQPVTTPTPFVPGAMKAIEYKPTTMMLFIDWYKRTQWQQLDQVIDYGLDKCDIFGSCGTIWLVLHSSGDNKNWRLAFDADLKTATFTPSTIESTKYLSLARLKDSNRLIMDAIHEKITCSDTSYTLLMMQSGGGDGLTHMVCNSNHWEAKIKPMLD